MMYLHEDRESFAEVLAVTSDRYGISGEIIEKDYYVSMLLKALHEVETGFVFRGGTSLSKCYQIIERFSEDIDLSLIPKADHITEGMKRNLKKQILAAVQQLGLAITNPADIRSRRDFNRYIAVYDSIYDQTTISHDIMIETFIAIRPFPVTTQTVYAYVQQVLQEAGQEKLIAEYGLMPFSMQVQDMRRTFIDKVFALCDYYLQNDIPKHSRHIYDIYQMMPQIAFNDEFKDLVEEVRKIRKKLRKCPSAQDEMDITDILSEIVNHAVYEKDYREITGKLLFKPIAYNVAVEGLNQLIGNRSFSKSTMRQEVNTQGEYR